MYISEFKTDNLTIRPLQKEDAAEWRAFFENNPNLIYLGLDENEKIDTTQYAQVWIDRQLWRYDNNQYGLLALVDNSTQKLVGQCGLLTQEIGKEPVVELAYHILPQYQDSAFALEAATAIRDYAFDKKLCQTLLSIVDVRNDKGQEFAQQLGMKKASRTKALDLAVYIYEIEAPAETI